MGYLEASFTCVSSLLCLSLFVAPIVTFTISSFVANESGEPGLAQLTLSNPSSTAITIQVLTTDGTAISTGNYFMFHWNVSGDSIIGGNFELP